MLSIDQALELLKDGERRQWLVADWSWHNKEQGNGGVYIGLIQGDLRESCLERASWTVSKGSELIGFTMWHEDGVEKTEYSYAPVSGDSWPLIIHRDFHGLVSKQYDLLEEFRLFHNLWHDRKTDNYYKIKDDGDKQKIIFRDSKDALLVDTAALRQFCAARDLYILLQVDSVQYFDETQLESSEEIREAGLFVSRHISNDTSFISKPAFGRLLGKRLIEPLSKEKCGVWPFEDEKSFESYIIGVNEEGKDVLHTSDPEALADYFGKNPESPHYLTPIYFRKEVLKKYFEKPSLYSVEDGHLSCGSMWGVRMDNDHDDQVIVFLGDLGSDLPESEQRYWRSFNTRPDGGLSETCFKRSFLGQFSDPSNAELTIKTERKIMLEKWREAFGFDLYSEIHKDDQGILADLRLPISEEWTEFDKCTIAATKIFIDYLNESMLAKLAVDEINNMKANNPKKPVRGIDKLQAWFFQHDGKDAFSESLETLRTLQALRSKSAAHRKSSALTDLLKKHGMEESSPRDVYRNLVLNPLLSYCQKLTLFAESNISDVAQ